MAFAECSLQSTPTRCIELQYTATHCNTLQHPVSGWRVRSVPCQTDCTENATAPKSTKTRNSNSSVQIQIESKSQFAFVPQDTDQFEFLDLVDLRGVAFSVTFSISGWCWWSVIVMDYVCGV